MSGQEAFNRTEKVIRFGPYEADLSAGELRKDGRIVRLQEQPFQILAALLNRPGEVVTREELRERLWPRESFGDFDQGLNTAINKLREALGDSAANPRFIETLPKRGYRFTHSIDAPTAPVEQELRPGRQPARISKSLPLLLAMFGIGASLFAFLLMRRSTPDPQLPVRRFTINRPFPTSSLYVRMVAISPNGRHIAIIDDERTRKLWIRDLDQEAPREIEGSEGALGLFWSPDSTMIGFGAGSKLKKVSVKGGPVIEICDMKGRNVFGGSWSPDGNSIVFPVGNPSVLYSVPASGGQASVLVSPEGIEAADSSEHLNWVIHPEFVPLEDGSQAVIFQYQGSLILKNLSNGRQHRIGKGGNPIYAPGGRLLYESGNTVWSRPFSLKQLRFEGEAIEVARNALDPSVSTDGTLVYRDAVREQLVWRDRRAGSIGELGPPARGVTYPAISPDSRRAAAEIREGGNQDIWVFDISNGTRIRLTTHPAVEVLPAWDPKSMEIAFSSYRSGNTDIFLRSADAASEEKPLSAEPQHERVADWSQDGQYILYTRLHPTNGFDLWYLKRNASHKWEPFPLLQTSFNESSPKISPDGKYMAYLSDESGRREAYVREFPTGARKWALSRHGASQLRWSRNGRELFYAEAGTLISVSVRTSPDFAMGRVTRLFSHAAFGGWYDANYDVSADGQRILLPERVGSQEHAIHVVQNWLAAVREGRQHRR